jgi:DnaK suppressor protein
MSHNPAADLQTNLTLRRAELIRRWQRVQDDLRRSHEPLANDAKDQAIQLENDEALAAIEKAALDEVVAIEAALERLASGHYGVCAVCSGRIPAARLQAVPYAVTCTACASPIK